MDGKNPEILKQNFVDQVKSEIKEAKFLKYLVFKLDQIRSDQDHNDQRTENKI